MYQYQGLRDIIFIMLYGGAAMLAVVACLYLLLRRSNVVLLASIHRWHYAVGQQPL